VETLNKWLRANTCDAALDSVRSLNCCLPSLSCCFFLGFHLGFFFLFQIDAKTGFVDEGVNCEFSQLTIDSFVNEAGFFALFSVGMSNNKRKTWPARHQTQ